MELEINSVSNLNNDNSDTIVLVYWNDASDTDGLTWKNDTRHFDRVPNVGEYIALSRDGDWYEVKAVVHMGFPLDYDAELYCVKVADKFALRRSFGQ